MARLDIGPKQVIMIILSGNSSVGRAQPCQGWGREFESRFPLHSHGWVAEWSCSGLQSRLRRFDSGLGLFMIAWVAKLVDARDLKSLGILFRAGSTPAPGTIPT